MVQQVDKPFPLLSCCSLSDPREICERACPVLSPGRVSLGGFPLRRTPSLHLLHGRYPRVRRLPWYYARDRLLDGLHRGLRLVALPRLAPPPPPPGRSPGVRTLPWYSARDRLLAGLHRGLRLVAFPRLPLVHH